MVQRHKSFSFCHTQKKLQSLGVERFGLWPPVCCSNNRKKDCWKVSGKLSNNLIRGIGNEARTRNLINLVR
jgi:hypothetical protein